MEKPKPNIAIMGLRGIPANYGGFETFAEELAPRLVELGFDVTVYGRSNVIKYKEPLYKGVRLKILPTISQKYLDTIAHTFLSSLHAAVFERFDLILMVNAANAPFTLINRLSGSKVVLNVDGIERLRKKWGKMGSLYYRLGEMLATKLPSKIVSDAQSIHDYYQEEYSQPSELITYGADTSLVPAGETLAKLKLNADDYFLCVTRLEPENNPDLVIRAYKQVVSDKPLVIVGDAPYATDYKQHLKSLAQQDDRVILAGAIYGQGYRELISNAFAYVQATEVGGTHPALVESMAVGSCILANLVPEHEDVLDDAGIYYDKNSVDALAEAMTDVSHDEVLRQSKKTAARKRAMQNYSWDSITQQYADLFLQLLGRELSSQKDVKA